MKSVAGVALTEAHLTESGLTAGAYRDHEFMIVRAAPIDGRHVFITQRDPGLSILARIKPRFVDGVLHLTRDGAEAIPIEPDRSGREMNVVVWDDAPAAIDQGDTAAEWLSDHLGLQVRLVKASGPFRRLASQNYVANTSAVRFQDAYPIHWFPIESVIELSERAGQNIPWQSFRPQIVVEGMPAQSEHRIRFGEIGGIPFLNAKPCTRCIVTTVDQETGIPRGKEPLLTLAKYKIWIDRKGAPTVIFGENMLPMGSGPIAIGDRLVVTEERNPPLVPAS